MVSAESHNEHLGIEVGARKLGRRECMCTGGCRSLLRMRLGSVASVV